MRADITATMHKEANLLKNVEVSQDVVRFSNLLEIVEMRSNRAAGASWWGPVIGSDEQLPSDSTDPSPVTDLVSDDKFIPMTACEVDE